MSSESEPFNSSDPYYLLRLYARDAKTKSRAYGYSEGYYLNLWKIFNYPIVILSAIGSVLAGIDIHQYVLMGLSLMTLVLTGFDKIVNTKDKEASANHMKVEYSEINKNVKQFIYSNNRTHDEIKEYSGHICEMLNKWSSISPPISDKFIKRAELECVQRKRNSYKEPSPTSKKKTLKLSNIQIKPE